MAPGEDHGPRPSVQRPHPVFVVNPPKANDSEAALRDFLHRHGTSMEAIEHVTIRISWPSDDG